MSFSIECQMNLSKVTATNYVYTQICPCMPRCFLELLEDEVEVHLAQSIPHHKGLQLKIYNMINGCK